MARLLYDRDGDTYYKEVRVADHPDELSGLLNGTRWQILSLIAERPRYPADIADELDMHEQNVYYHIRKLAESGIIEVAETRERGGAVAKYYTVTDHGFALELPYGEERLAEFSVTPGDEPLRSFLHPFVANGAVNTRIVVGSPDPHGPHQVRARDPHLAADIALFLGQYGSFPGSTTVLDVDVKSAGDLSGNLLLLGGPLTNMITAEMNAYLPIKFDTDQFPFREIVSEQTGTTYADDTVGFIARTPNPEDPESAVMVVAGVRMAGTRAAVMALTERHDDLLQDYETEEKWGAVVKGRDMDGDGSIDDIEILE